MVPSRAVRILLDYRPALRQRTGVGEYVHELARALALSRIDSAEQLAVLTSSWKDRPSPTLAAELAGAAIIDRRVPVRALTWAWNRLGWPPVEWLGVAADVVHSPSPLLIPTRNAAQVITIHDLDFLRNPERTRGEMRRDYPTLAAGHARRADHIIVPSRHTAGEVITSLAVPRDRLSVCPHGAPAWAGAVAAARAATRDPGETILFLGTLEPRKNVGGLLDAYADLIARRPDAPPLTLAGGATAPATAWLARAQRPPLAGRVRVAGYVAAEARPQLFQQARMLVLPSLDEGFGLPVLEAMACGVPVVISDRGALPEVAGDAARPVAPEDAPGLSREMERLLVPEAAAEAAARGLRQATRFTWTACAHATRTAYAAAIAQHRGRSA